MNFLQAFPIAVIDEDYDGKRAAGRGMRSHDAGSGQEPQFHQAQGLILGQIQPVQNAVLATTKLGK